MARWILNRRLAQHASRLTELREELRITDDQLGHLLAETHDLSLRALVAETPAAEFEYRDAKRHSDALEKHRARLVAEISTTESRINQILDSMSERAS